MPADIPVEQPTAHEVWLNIRTARLLGIKTPEAVTTRAGHLTE